MKEYFSAADLPEAWDDDLGDNIYMRRYFLRFMEGRSDNTDERRVAFEGADGRLAERFVLFRRPDYVITQFTDTAVRMDTTFIHVPLSVSKPGIVMAGANGPASAHIRGLRGLKLVMNLPEAIRPRGFAQIRTCPRCVLHLRWNDFVGYMGSLRSAYRNRYKKALQRSALLTLRLLRDNREFDEKLYGLYLQVHDKARYKVEKLKADFFRGDFFKIFVLESPEGAPVAFFQLLENGPELIFEFAGMDYALAPRYDAYVRVLLEIVRYGIENDFERIDFGQTAEDAKLKIGCVYEHLFVLAHHSNPFLNLLLKLCAPLLRYNPLKEDSFTVFKDTPKPCGESPGKAS